MSQRHTALRSLHDLGLAAWFGGTLMGAIGVNGAAAKYAEPRQRLRLASKGWSRWTPVNAAAIGSHLIGATGELVTESPRVALQSGVGKMSIAKAGLTAAALGTTAYSRMLGKRIEQADGMASEGITEPGEESQQIASEQRQLKVLQWAIPVLTGALIIVTALAGEQQKPRQVVKGVFKQARKASKPSNMRRMAQLIQRAR
ncbi:hypothetical protein [Melissospora conviva]|uniref:hypothetical protein n=1 Tax=Melissospora conviva TaxID=3388432 RepID=UPI003B81ADEA